MAAASVRTCVVFPNDAAHRKLSVCRPALAATLAVYEGRVAVLTGEGCTSATEHFVSGMAEAGALLCGTPTSGACGWIRRLELPGGARLYVSQTFPLHTGGIPSPLLGIPPHLWAVQTLADLKAGEDTALQVALGWVNSPAPLPVRLQPTSSFSGRR